MALLLLENGANCGLGPYVHISLQLLTLLTRDWSVFHQLLNRERVLYTWLVSGGQPFLTSLNFWVWSKVVPKVKLRRLILQKPFFCTQISKNQRSIKLSFYGLKICSSYSHIVYLQSSDATGEGKINKTSEQGFQIQSSMKADEQFRAVAEAYQVLFSPARQRRYLHGHASCAILLMRQVS